MRRDVSAPAVQPLKDTMASIDRYVFRTAFGAFLVVLITLTTVIWITQILRQIDLITSQGQTIVVFLSITSLLVPILMLVIAPLAMVIGVTHTLLRLNGDSELVVMSAAGFSPRRLFRPILVLALLVALMVAVLVAYLAPRLQREINDRITKVRADVVANIIQPGSFAALERGLTFHISERHPNNQFRGILIDDFRDESERVTIVADYGEIIENPRGTFLVLTDGTVQRQRIRDRDPTFVRFERYAFDLSRFTTISQIPVGLRETYLWDLISPSPDDPVYKRAPQQFRAELHDRVISALYPLAFAVIVFAFLGMPRTTRQGQTVSLIMVIAGVAGLRLTGFACTVVSRDAPAAIVLLYLLLAATIAWGGWVIWRGTRIDFDGRIDWSAMLARIVARLPRAAGAAPRRR
jgi:lipopolysaccharide export system permease protein